MTFSIARAYTASGEDLARAVTLLLKIKTTYIPKFQNGDHWTAFQVQQNYDTSGLENLKGVNWWLLDLE
jgi:hypothetical protein